MRRFVSCLTGVLVVLAMTATAARPSEAASPHATWKLCVLHYGPKGGFHDKECYRYALARETRRPIGHTWSQRRISASVVYHITWPVFYRPQPRYALPGCPYAIARWASYIVPAAHAYGVSVAVMTGVMTIESGGNPMAYNASSGARGLYQFLPSTAAALGILPFNPASATYGAARYLRSVGVVRFSGGGYDYGTVYARSCD